MLLAQVEISSWDKPEYYDVNGLPVVSGSKVIVKGESGSELGTVLALKKATESEMEAIMKQSSENPEDGQTEKQESSRSEGESKGDAENIGLKPILRLATSVDYEKIPNEEKKREALDYCKRTVERYDLPMKIVGVHYTLDGSKLTFAFIAEGRVDFRELVKDLMRHFNRTIRLQQIGIRDEAKIMGDCGHCGRELCCKKFLHKLQSITSEMADLQQCVHRGSDRISGMCGRLMCCLAYENSGYELLKSKMPAIGAKVNVDGKRGTILGHHVLKQSVDVEFPPEKGEGRVIMEVDLNRHNKKQQ